MYPTTRLFIAGETAFRLTSSTRKVVGSVALVLAEKTSRTVCPISARSREYVRWTYELEAFRFDSAGKDCSTFVPVESITCTLNTSFASVVVVSLVVNLVQKESVSELA